MTDINLQTITPDTTLPTTGFLFGADSQASGSPSVYTVQSVATTLLGSTTLSGATITADAPVLNLAQTWNNAAVTFTGLKLNATDTASASGSRLVDLQINSTSRFHVTRGAQSTGYTIGTNTVGEILNNNSIGLQLKWSAVSVSVSGNGLEVATNGAAILSTRGAANLRFGAADAAAPVAQILSVQSVVAGTTNTAGANLTITGSQGTGTGAGGSIIFQVAPAGSSGSAQNALSTALTIASTGNVSLTNSIIAQNGSSGVLSSGYVGSWNSGRIGFSNSAALVAASTLDAYISRSAAGILAITDAAELTEMTAPAAPAANKVRIYAVDNGGGKTQLMALFATGAAQQIAIEP